ncbi:hypothetical protein BT93_A1759 [Corymbia citriodora subsp. variegata]|nr:hypothetical protein BT93_A1759 [Corymbia citriodora subsp. variegata]
MFPQSFPRSEHGELLLRTEHRDSVKCELQCWKRAVEVFDRPKKGQRESYITDHTVNTCLTVGSVVPMRREEEFELTTFAFIIFGCRDGEQREVILQVVAELHLFGRDVT